MWNLILKILNIETNKIVTTLSYILNDIDTRNDPSIGTC